MSNTNEIRRGRHCVFARHAHLVFVSKYRRKVFSEASLKTLEIVLREISEKLRISLIEFNGESDHVHLLIQYPPQLSLSKLVNSLKGSSSYRLRSLHPELQERYWKGVLWSPSYFAASCGGAPLEILKQYIEQQKRPT